MRESYIKKQVAEDWCKDVHFKVFTQNLGKPLSLGRYLSYRTYLTFSGICWYLLALQVTFILLNEKLNAWSCQWSSYEDSTWSQNTINYLAIARLQNSRPSDDHGESLFSLYSQFIETLHWKYLYLTNYKTNLFNFI